MPTRPVPHDCVVVSEHEGAVLPRFHGNGGLTRIICTECEVYDVDAEATAVLKNPGTQVDREKLSMAIAKVYQLGGLVALDVGMISRLSATPRLADGTLDIEPLKPLAEAFRRSRDKGQ